MLNLPFVHGSAEDFQEVITLLQNGEIQSALNRIDQILPIRSDTDEANQFIKDILESDPMKDMVPPIMALRGDCYLRIVQQWTNEQVKKSGQSGGQIKIGLPTELVQKIKGHTILCLTMFRDDINILWPLTGANFYIGDVQGAIAITQRILQIDPSHPKAQLMMEKLSARP